MVRVNDFVGVLAADEWAAVSAAKKLKVSWSDPRTLVGNDGVREWMRAGPFESDELLVSKGESRQALAGAARRITAEYYWPLQSHGSMGPSCAVADVSDGKATIWSASQATHRFRQTIARVLGLPREAVRVVYLDGSGCYGMNGHDDAAADAALLSRAVGRPVRVQWMREDEHGWDPKGPPQLLSLEGALTGDGKIDAWRTEMWLPRATASLPNMPLLGPEAAGIVQAPGITTGLISQNGNPPYAVPNQEVLVHWIRTAPLRPSNFRAPGKVANCFAVESFTDELAAAAGRDPLRVPAAGAVRSARNRGAAPRRDADRLAGAPGRRRNPVSDAALRTSITRTTRGTSRWRWRPRSYERRARSAYVASRAHTIAGSSSIPMRCAAQIEGNILQTLSRTLHEEVIFDRSRVTSVDWASYPILTFPEVPEILIDLVDRPREPPLGAGEAAATAVPAALANAIFDAVGVRLRTVPFTRQRLLAALA